LDNIRMHGTAVKKKEPVPFNYYLLTCLFYSAMASYMYLKNPAKFTEGDDRTQLYQTVVTIVAFHKC